MKLQGQVALVTGANRGLGSHFVRHLLAAGASKVYATARDTTTMPAELGSDPRVAVLNLDITDPASVAGAAAAAPDVTVLVNNAGVLGWGDVLTGDLDAFQRDLNTNYVGTLRAAREFVPVIERNGGGAIVNVLTLIALAPVAPMAGYSASKAAAHSMTLDRLRPLKKLNCQWRPLGTSPSVSARSINAAARAPVRPPVRGAAAAKVPSTAAPLRTVVFT